MDLRKHKRIRVQFRSSFSGGPMVGGEGLLIDLTIKGCRVESDVRVQTGNQLELRVYLPDHDSSLDVESSAVRWSRGREFGLEFVRMRSEAQKLLHQVVTGLEGGASQ